MRQVGRGGYCIKPEKLKYLCTAEGKGVLSTPLKIGWYGSEAIDLQIFMLWEMTVTLFLKLISDFSGNGLRYVPIILWGARYNNCFLSLQGPLNWGHGQIKRSLNEKDGSEFSLLYADRLDSLCLLRSMSAYTLISITVSISSLDQSSVMKDN